MKKECRMKKGKLLSMAAALALAMCVCGCGAAKEADSAAEEYIAGAKAQDADADAQDAGQKASDVSPEGENTEASEADKREEDTDRGYFFDVGGVRVEVDMDMDELAAELGESKSIFEAPSCAGEGISYLYNFISYEIETYPAGDGKNRIGYIVLKDDTVATAEGIDLSMTKADIIRVYGEDYEEGGGRLTYEKAGMKLNFIFEGDSILSIEYVSAVIG